MTYPLYQVVEGITLEILQLPNETIASGVTFFVLEGQQSATTSWGAPPNFLTVANLLKLQAVSIPVDAPNLYAVGLPWTTTTAAQAAAQADYAALISRRIALITQQQLGMAIASGPVVAVIGTPYGPG